MGPELKKKAAEAKSRGQEAFNRKDYYLAIDAYTQVCYSSLLCFIGISFLSLLQMFEIFLIILSNRFHDRK